METILVIDDDDEFRSVLRSILEMEGYNVLDASNGIEGINIFNANCPDLVITDMIMPGKEGFETIMTIKRACSKTKIIAMSGGGVNDASSYLYLAKRYGVVHTLEKPFNREKLLEAVHELLIK